ncbi:hypothetical protein LEMLEM_LOCUS13130 [Lemmus lemmus]
MSLLKISLPSFLVYSKHCSEPLIQASSEDIFSVGMGLLIAQAGLKLT